MDTEHAVLRETPRYQIGRPNQGNFISRVQKFSMAIRNNFVSKMKSPNYKYEHCDSEIEFRCPSAAYILSSRLTTASALSKSLSIRLLQVGITRVSVRFSWATL
jgi:hypothetical protein